MTVRDIKKYLKDKEVQDKLFRRVKAEGKVKNKKEFKARLAEKNLFINEFFSEAYKEEIWEFLKSLKYYSDTITNFISFSSEVADDFDQILMWSHYCDRHKGLRIHFDSSMFTPPKYALSKISYFKERSELNTSLNVDKSKFLPQVRKVLIT